MPGIDLLVGPEPPHVEEEPHAEEPLEDQRDERGDVPARVNHANATTTDLASGDRLPGTVLRHWHDWSLAELLDAHGLAGIPEEPFPSNASTNYWPNRGTSPRPKPGPWSHGSC